MQFCKTYEYIDFADKIRIFQIWKSRTIPFKMKYFIH